MRETARALLAAVAFLTRIPVGRAVALDGDDVRRGGAFFPLVGLVVGGATAAVAWASDDRLPPSLAATLAVAVGAALTGAMHLDALADTFDGSGGATRERALEIMRDHSLGAYGVTALALALIVRVTAVAALAGERHWLPILAAAALGRATAAPLGRLVPLARTDGLARTVNATGNATALLAAGLGVAAAATLVCPRGAVAMVAATVIVAAIGAVWSRRRLGGITGDICGAVIELAELAALVVAVPWS